jgi:hypothetical protein
MLLGEPTIINQITQGDGHWGITVEVNCKSPDGDGDFVMEFVPKPMPELRRDRTHSLPNVAPTNYPTNSTGSTISLEDWCKEQGIQTSNNTK